MKKRVLSIILMLMISSTSAFAFSYTSDYNSSSVYMSDIDNMSLEKVDESELSNRSIEFSEIENADLKYISNYVANDVYNEKCENDLNLDKESRFILQDWIVNDITAKPLLICEDTQDLYYINGLIINNHRYVDNQPRFDWIYLSKEESKELFDTIEMVIQNQSINSGMTFDFYGWDFSTQIYVQAEKPKYIQFTPSEECVSMSGEQTLTIPYQSTKVTIPAVFKTSLSDRYELKSLGIRGGFFFLYPTSNQLGSLMINSGFTTNWEVH